MRHTFNMTEDENTTRTIKRFDKLMLWYRMEGKYLFRDFKNGINNLCKWFSVIWKDRNYDHSYIYTILAHKLKLQSDYIGSREIHTRAKRDSEIMMTCVRLIDKCREEYYRSEYSDFYASKNWFEKVKDDPEYSTWESKILREDFQDYYDMYPLIYKRVIKGEGPFDFDGEDELEVRRSIAMNIGYINQERAHKLLFKLLEKNIEKWWD